MNTLLEEVYDHRIPSALNQLQKTAEDVIDAVAVCMQSMNQIQQEAQQEILFSR